MVEQQRLDELKAHLWKAADILRGSIDSGDYKHYIFGLLFYKRLCDVWEEEYEEALAIFDNDEDMAKDPDQHRFVIPEGAFWKDIRKKTTNIGNELNKAFIAIQDNNTKLYGVFNGIDFNNKDKFTDAILEKLTAHFDKFRMRNCDVEPDVLGQAYEYLIAQFADDAGKKGGEFYTPKMVVRLLTALIRPEEELTVYDPACGSGGMLIEFFKQVEEKGKNAKSLKLYGQEKNLNTWSICKMNMFLHDIQDAFIERGDTLIDPKHLVHAGQNEHGMLREFDRVIANPPFSLKEWGYEAWKEGDKFGRDTYGTPPKNVADYAFIQHMIASLNDKGILGVVVPHGVLFRGGAEGKIRKALLEKDIVEAVIGLASNLFFGTGIPAALLIINKDKPEERKGKVLFIEASNDYKEGKNQNYLLEENIQKITSAFYSNEDIEKFSKFIDIEEIEKNDFNLNIKRYVDTGEEEVIIDVKKELAELREKEQEYAQIEAKFTAFMKQLGYED